MIMKMFGFFLSLWQTVLGFTISLPVIGRIVDVLTAFIVTLLRLGTGAQVARGIASAPRPKKLLKLYEYEGCPFCRKVRENITILDLDVVVYPCPRETLKSYGVCKDSRFRPEVKLQGGSLKFPFLVDDNTGVSMYESADIIEYLWATYGQGAKRPGLDIQRWFGNGAINNLTSFLSAFWRPLPMHGVLRAPSDRPAELLHLWSFEASPYCRLVREKLSSLEIPYVLHNMGVVTEAKRKAFKAKHGKTLFPYLEDPNGEGWNGFESAEIVKYLESAYQTGPPPSESFSDYSTNGASASHGTVPGSSKKTQ